MKDWILKQSACETCVNDCEYYPVYIELLLCLANTVGTAAKLNPKGVYKLYFDSFSYGKKIKIYTTQKRECCGSVSFWYGSGSDCQTKSIGCL